MRYIDIHCHLDFSDYDSDREEVLGRMRKKEVGAITIGTDLQSSKRAVKIAKENENVWACIGIHPSSESKFVNYELWEELISYPKVVAIGECGLDYFKIKNQSEKENQKILFKQQIEFAIKHNKPMMLHCRDSYDDVLDILESYKKEAGDRLKGNAHFFSGSIRQAVRFLDLGFAMSFAGVITFARNYDEVIKYLPPSFIMSETDAPFVAPIPYRGGRNEPIFVIETIKKLAEIRNEDEERIRVSILNNAKKFFNL